MVLNAHLRVDHSFAWQTRDTLKKVFTHTCYTPPTSPMRCGFWEQGARGSQSTPSLPRLSSASHPLTVSLCPRQQGQCLRVSANFSTLAGLIHSVGKHSDWTFKWMNFWISSFQHIRSLLTPQELGAVFDAMSYCVKCILPRHFWSKSAFSTAFSKQILSGFTEGFR